MLVFSSLVFRVFLFLLFLLFLLFCLFLFLQKNFYVY